MNHSMTKVPDLIFFEFNEKDEQVTALTRAKNLRTKFETTSKAFL